MKGFIDRIENTKIAVVILDEGGEILVPATAFPFEIHEGMHLQINFTPDPESEKKSLKRVRGLQQELLKRTDERNKRIGEDKK